MHKVLVFSIALGWVAASAWSHHWPFMVVGLGLCAGLFIKEVLK